MSFTAAIRLALGALLVNKGRSALTCLGIIIGIAAVIALVAAGEGARRQLDQRLENAGKNLIIVRPGLRTGTTVADVAPLTTADAAAVRHEAGPWLVGAVAWQMTPRVVSTPTGTWQTDVVGTEPEFVRVQNWRLDKGRSFDADDAKKRAPVCVLGQTVRRQMFPYNPDPVGRWVGVDRLRLRVIGVLAPKGHTPLGTDQDDQVIMPLATLQQKLAGREDIAMILANARSAAVIDRAKQAITEALRRQHHIAPGLANNFDVSSVRELAEFAVIMTTSLQALTAVIASISLVVGGVGIMNIMLVAVTERTREIGIRLAVGATPGNILAQFLIEAVVLSLAGGAVGVVFGVAGAAGLAALAGWPALVSPAVILLALAITTGIGIFFGFYPALKASRLDPIQALRFE